MSSRKWSSEVRQESTGAGHASAKSQTITAQIHWLPRLFLTLPWVGEQWHRVGLCATFRGRGTLTKGQGTAPWSWVWALGWG